VGLAVSFVVAVDSIRLIRPDLLIDPEPSWSAPRLLLVLSLVTISTFLGGLAAVAFLLWSRIPGSRKPLRPLAFSRRALIGLTALAIVSAGFFRFVALDRLPPVLYIDEVCVVQPALALQGSWRDFHDSIRFLPVGDRPTAVIGVAYLEGYRLLLKLWGTTVFGVRFHVALAGTLSVITAALLARSLLPRGGGTLAAVILAGLRWSLIVSRFGWNALALAPIADIAALAVLRARRRTSSGAALAGGLVAGAGSYVYLGSWIVAAALIGFLLWPRPVVSAVRRTALAAIFFGGFLLAASPILLVREHRPASYFARAADQNILRDMRRTKTWMPAFSVVADAFQAPWFVEEPLARQDLRKSRLGWLVGVPLAVAFLRAFAHPREDLSALLFSHAGAACAASLYWGQPGHPNGVRFAYLTTLTAVGAAAGVLWLVGLAPSSSRRLAGIVAVGCLALASLQGARDALLVWASSQTTFDAFDGGKTLVARTALRWERYGFVGVDSKFGEWPTYEVVHDYRLDPDEARQRTFFKGVSARQNPDRSFRIVLPGTSRRERERLVEVIQDGAGKDLAAVLGQAGSFRP
jgi:hypothetical protein